MEYINQLYVILYFTIGIAIFSFFNSDSPKTKDKNLTFIMVSLGVNLCTIPVALFIGVMATDSPYSTGLDFWGGFLFIQGIPLLLLLAAFLKFALTKKTKQV
ncbi:MULTISPECIES: hypothetical protein [Bacillus]|uniref:hypothetical protein n=1 Tax=Bacillus TaxID=1386 RepID=UPI0007DAF23C|nr:MULTISPECIES: hypothetical protein [Bacillus cereus group]MBJ8085056.1 hypothetical protein [Bacillus cereus group sp. N14]MDI6678172.1 hypothetical protein [Bacillus wiedmannii]OAK05531.1 hypothetical protein A6279_28130 [Bacillus wiedmannii]OAK05644.1 hypothetical protein A6278_27880 [Bacillus wiedmannii]PEI75414.1 hypothetical protein CN646_02745 [Bacillus wiedmannii]